MTIGILTFWETLDNYGQVLQGFALQTYLRSIGHDAFIIRYDHDEIFRKKNVKLRYLKKFLKALIIYPAIHYLSHYNERKAYQKRIEYNKKQNIQRNFDEFREKYFKFSTKLYLTLNELQGEPPMADVYIAGSDQIWGWSLKKYNNRVFFLDFGVDTIKRIAYAPSFAMDKYPDEYKSELSDLLKRFDAISVREKTGVVICNTVGVEAKWVCDPTMLLYKQSYEQLLLKKQNRPYIFIYSINIEKKEEIFWDGIKSVASKNKLEIKVTTSSGHIAANELFDDVTYDYSTVEGWLSDIYYSEYIVTTSFHGVSLCILLNKKFAFVPLRGKYSKGNNRVLDLLDRLCLTNQVVDNVDDINKIFNYEVNWDVINKQLDIFRKMSQNYLNCNLC